MVLRPLVTLFAGLGLALTAAAATVAPLPAAAPASVGLSGERLDRLAAHLEDETRRQYSAGYVLMVARHGKLAYARAIGQRDVEQHVPMTLDTRFRIASMTKPVTAVAVLMLYEDGRFLLDEGGLPSEGLEYTFTGHEIKAVRTLRSMRREAKFGFTVGARSDGT